MNEEEYLLLRDFLAEQIHERVLCAFTGRRDIPRMVALLSEPWELACTLAEDILFQAGVEEEDE